MVRSVAFIGLQDGDEGKGKETNRVNHALMEKIQEEQNDANQELFKKIRKKPSLLNHEMLRHFEQPKRLLTYRWQGGANAGHVWYVGGEKRASHQLSSSIAIQDVYSLLGMGMFINPRLLKQEIEGLQDLGISITDYNLGISSKAHMTLDHHIAEDAGYFNLKKHESTGKGIKQTARDKSFRIGMRFVELLDRDLMVQILKDRTFDTSIYPNGFPKELGSPEQYADSYGPEREVLAQFLVLEHEVFNDPQFFYRSGEGAQGNNLDIDVGQYPGITSSNPTLPTHRPEILYGIAKAYRSSVGTANRPFISAMEPELQDKLWKIWEEYGTTTGKRREIGWIDIPSLKYAIESVEIDFLGLTCLDRLENVSEHRDHVQISVGHYVDGTVHTSWTTDHDRRDFLARAKPVYIKTPAWNRTVEKDGKALTPPAQEYVTAIEDSLERTIDTIGIGPKKDQTIIRRDVVDYFT